MGKTQAREPEAAEEEAGPVNIVNFPGVPSSCSGRTMPGLTAPELRARAVANFYAAERRSGADPSTAYDRSQEFGRDLDRLAVWITRNG